MIITFKFIMLIIYLLFNIYFIFRTICFVHYCFPIKKKKTWNTILIILFEIFSATIFLGAFLPKSVVQLWLLRVSNVFVGTFIFLLMFTLVFDVGIAFYYFFKQKRRVPKKSIILLMGIITILGSIILTVYGTIHNNQIYTKSYDVSIEKNISNLTVVLVADLHLDYTDTVLDVQKMVDEINKNNPDIVIFAGDIINNDFDYVPEPNKLIGIFKTIKNKYGVYAVYGNHDVSELLVSGFSIDNIKNPLIDERLDNMLKESNIKVLKDESILINDEFYLIGRLDYHKPGNISQTRKEISELLVNVDKNKPIILLDHEPVNYKKDSLEGIDLVLSGHTHNGQFFPLTLMNSVAFDNAYGIKQFNQMTSVVTSGIGTYGPALRIGTNNEVTVINLKTKDE